MPHGETARPQPEEVSQEEKPKFDLEKEAAAAKAETEAAEPASQFAQDVEAYRGIGDKIARKEKEKQDLTAASGALGKFGTRGAETLGRTIDAEIEDLKKRREEILAGYGENGKEFTDAMADLDKLSGKLAEKQEKLNKLEVMISFLNYPGGERGAKAEIEFLKENVADLQKEMAALHQKFAGKERPSRETEEALADLRQIEKDRVAAEKAAEEPILLTPEMRKQPEEPILLTPEMRKPIEVTDEMITEERTGEGVAKGSTDAEGLVFDAFSEMTPLSDKEMAEASKTGKFSPERQAALNKAVAFLENRVEELVEGRSTVVAGEKADGTLEAKRTVHEPGTKELAQAIKEKYGVDIQAQNDANAVSRLKRWGFGLKKLFNPGLGRLANEHNRKENAAAALKGEINETKAMMKEPAKYVARKQDAWLKMYALRQRMKRPAPVVNVKVR